MKYLPRWTMIAVTLGLLVLPSEGAQGGNPKLEGTWELVKIQFGDQETKPPADFKPPHWVFKGDQITLKNVGKLDEVGVVVVDDAKTPPELTLTKFGKTPDILAIYAVTGTTLKVGLKGTGMARPMSFDAKETLILTLKKVG